MPAQIWSRIATDCPVVSELGPSSGFLPPAILSLVIPCSDGLETLSPEYFSAIPQILPLVVLIIAVEQRAASAAVVYIAGTAKKAKIRTMRAPNAADIQAPFNTDKPISLVLQAITNSLASLSLRKTH